MGNTTCDGDDDLSPLFSEDVFIQILVFLPVISLLRFKSVCKSWLALIDSPFFIDLHTATTTTTTFNSSSSSSSKFGSFILHASEKMFMLSSVSESESESVCGGGDEDDIIDNDLMDSFELPSCFIDPLHSRYYMHMIGTCNGLICIHDSTRERKAVYLWNPATRQIRTLPQPIITIEEEEGVVNKYTCDFFAFGFDVKTKDYKVVMFKSFSTADQWNKYFSRIQVYSLSTDSWRLLEGIHYWHALPYNVCFQNQGIYMNGCYFFVGKDETEDWLWGGGKTSLVCNNSLMYSFDFTKEILTTMQFPDHDSRHDLILSCLGGDKIALFMIQRNISIGGRLSQFHDCGHDNEYYDIWVLNEQPGSNWVGVVNKESWTKLHSFRKINKLKHLSEPKCISNNGEFALISTKKGPNRLCEVELFNLVTKEAVKDLPIDYKITRASFYMQSLVSITGGNGAAATTTTGQQPMVEHRLWFSGLWLSDTE